MKKIIFIFLSITLVYSYYFKTNVEEDLEVINQKQSIYDISMDNFKDIKIGDSRDTIISKLGRPSRIDNSEYNFKWYIYNEDYYKFAMVGIRDNIVMGIYSNNIDNNEIDIK